MHGLCLRRGWGLPRCELGTWRPDPGFGKSGGSLYSRLRAFDRCYIHATITIKCCWTWVSTFTHVAIREHKFSLCGLDSRCEMICATLCKVLISYRYHASIVDSTLTSSDDPFLSLRSCLRSHTRSMRTCMRDSAEGLSPASRANLAVVSAPVRTRPFLDQCASSQELPRSHAKDGSRRRAPRQAFTSFPKLPNAYRRPGIGD